MYIFIRRRRNNRRLFGILNFGKLFKSSEINVNLIIPSHHAFCILRRTGGGKRGRSETTHAYQYHIDSRSIFNPPISNICNRQQLQITISVAVQFLK